MASAQCNSSNSILSLKETPFGRRNNEDKLATIQLGPPRPNITIKQVATKKGKSYTRGFSKNWYQRKSWLAGCEVANAVFCYPCLLFHPEGSMTDSTAWTTTGVKDMHHLSEKVKKHEQAKLHRQLSEVLWFWEGEHCHSTGWGIQASSASNGTSNVVCLSILLFLSLSVCLSLRLFTPCMLLALFSMP